MGRLAVKGVSCVKALEFVDGKLIEAGYRIPGANPEEYLKTAYHFRQIAGWGDAVAWIRLYERDVMYDWFPARFVAISGVGDAYAIVTCANLLSLMRHLKKPLGFIKTHLEVTSLQSPRGQHLHPKTARLRSHHSHQ